MDGRVVEFVVEDGSPPVLDGIFNGSHDENDDKWYCVERRIAGSEDGENLQNVVISKKWRWWRCWFNVRLK